MGFPVQLENEILRIKNLDEKDKNLHGPKVSVRNTVPKYDIAVISAREELRRLWVRGDTPRLLVVTHQQTAHLGV